MSALSIATTILGALATSFVVMRQTTPPARLTARQYREVRVPVWADCVPAAERFESVTVVPYRREERAVRIRMVQLPKRGGYSKILHEWSEVAQ